MRSFLVRRRGVRAGARKSAIIGTEECHPAKWRRRRNRSKQCPMNNLIRSVRELPRLCQGRPEVLQRWLEEPGAPRLAACAAAIVAGGAVYGCTLGLWRAPVMGWYVAVKLPLLILLTLLTSGLLNGMMAQVLGSGLSFRQTMLAVLMSFASFSLITGALSPVTLLMVVSAPRPGEPGAADAYRTILLVQTVVIAYAGVVAHRRFYPVLRAASASAGAAPRVFVVWLAVNFLAGAQLSWNLRPFFGEPGKPPEFLRPDWNRSTFYESIWDKVAPLFLPDTP
jgi:hypothetical protein